MNPEIEQKLRWHLRDWAVPTTDTLVAVIGEFIEGLADSYEQGYAQGFEDGRAEGKESGYEQGYQDGSRDSEA